MNLQELYGDDLNNGAVTYFIVDLYDLDEAVEDFHSSINNVMPSSEVIPPRISASSDMMSSLRRGAPTYEPQEIIYRAKSSFISEMWDTLCGWITLFSLGSSDGFTTLESNIASTLEDIRKVNIIDFSSLDDHVQNFFK